MNNFGTNFGYTPKPSDIKKYTEDNTNYGSVKREIIVSDKEKVEKTN